MVKNFIIFFLFFVFSSSLCAHGDLHKRILEVTKEIHISPNSAFLYLKRGSLFYQHTDYKKSLQDLRKSRRLGYKSIEQDFLFAKNYFKLKKYGLSLNFSNKILKVQPNNVNAFKLVGKIYFKRNKFKKSALAFEKVIKLSRETLPDNYLDASSAWYALNTEEGIETSKVILKKGIEKLGNIIMMYNKLISLDVDQGEYKSAIEFQKKVIDFSPRKERGYLKLAQLQTLQKNYTEAIKSIEMAKKYYLDLPNRIKLTKFMKDFYSELELKEEKLKNVKLH